MAASRKRSTKYAAYVDRFQRRHGGLTPYQWRKRQLATVGITPWQLRQANRDAQVFGPQRRQTAAVLGARRGLLSVEAMDAENRKWSNNPPKGIEGVAQSGTFNVHTTDVDSRRGLAVLANAYHPEIGAANPAYVLAFYNAIVNPASNYYSDHDSDGDTYTPRLIGNKVMGNRAFHDYIVQWSEVIAEVTEDDMEQWYDERYSMALQ